MITDCAYKQTWFANSAIYGSLAPDGPITLIDGGARAGISSPFDKFLADRIRIVAFEPDAEAPIEAGADSTILRQALWSHDSRIRVHLAADPSTSSVYPPNERLLSCFEDRYGVPVRRTIKTLDVDATSIDSAVDRLGLKVDVIKLDIHSAEFEALNGAGRTLQEDALCVVVETWTSPIHEGQHLHAECEQLLNRAGFAKMGSIMEAVFQRKHRLLGLVLDNPQVVGYDSVFLKNFPNEYARLDKVKAIKLIAIADAFLFVGYALQVNDACRQSGLFSAEEHESIEQTLIVCNRRPTLANKVAFRASQFLRRAIAKGFRRDS